MVALPRLLDQLGLSAGSARSIRQPSPLQRVYSQSTCVPLNQKAWDSLALFYRKNDARLQFLPLAG